MRLIDADVCEKYFYEHLDDNAMVGAMNAIEEMPTVEPERKKGKWRLADIQNPDDKANGNYLYFCSNCFHADLHAKTQEVPYCWYCGAEMEG